MNTRIIGAQKEEMAKAFLEERGMRIIETNYHAKKLGEIDLIGVQDQYLVFVEVKFRSSERMGHAAEAVTVRKQRQICKAADYYRYTHRYGVEQSIRYDVVAIQGAEIQWIPNAFSHCGRYL